jgi:hypothetical protein
MIKLNRNVSKKPLIISLIFVLAFVNPYVELLQFTNPIAYMLDHYALYAAGLIAGYKYFRGSFWALLIGVIPAGFWHIPLFFALAASFWQYRVLCEVTLFVGGLLAGSYIPNMSLSQRLAGLAVYMLSDSILSIFFVLGYPQYSNVDYPFLQWSNNELPPVGIAMFLVMNIVLVYSIYKLMRNIQLF